MVALEVGRDLLADSPIDIGKNLVENIGQRLLAELDKVIVIGDGSTQPEGIFTASGISAVVTDNPSGPAAVDDLYSLVFAIGKQYRNGGSFRPCFVANDTTYSRFIGIPVSAQDQRRVFGMDPNQYTALGWPFKIQNDTPNTKIAYGAMQKYRMYRRQGNEVRWITESADLAKANTNLLVVRARYGGKVVDSNAFAKSTTLAA
jgi:HK97 family phage major capsid protein